MVLSGHSRPLGRRRERAWLLLGPFSCLRLYLRGSSDGARGLELDGQDWSVSSPFVARERRRQQQFVAQRQLRLEELTAARTIELQIVQKKIEGLELDIADAKLEIYRQREGVDEATLSRRGIGEQRLAADVIRQRRSQELQRQLRPLEAQIEAAGAQLRVLRGQAIELQAVIDQAKQRTEKVIARRARRSDLRIAVYCQAVFGQAKREEQARLAKQAKREERAGRKELGHEST